MTKNQDLQKELQTKVKPGVKPSDLKKLKRSKSADDITNISIPTEPNNPAEIKQLNSQITQLQQQFNSQLQQINSLFDPNAINYTQPIDFKGLYQHLKELLTNSPPQPLLLDQLKAKQKELESLRKKLEITNQKLTETRAELDNSLEVRHNSLKDWEKQQSIINQLNKELDETIDQTSEELITNDQEISSLRTKIHKLKTTKESLERELKLERIKKGTHPNPINSPDNFLPYSLYGLLAVWLVVILTDSKTENNEPKNNYNCSNLSDYCPILSAKKTVRIFNGRF